MASFLIPVGIMIFTYLLMGIYPGSDRSVLASDAFSQFANFHASYRNMLLGKQGLFYTWNASLGLNYLALMSYYLGGLFTPLVVLFPNQYMPDALYFLTLLKIGLAGTAFWIYAKQTFKIEPWSHVALSVAYALTSFATAHSELVMWLDAFIYLPLIILGIDRVIDKGKPKVLFFSYLILFLTSFYMGFMIGIFSVLYFLARLFSDWKKNKTAILPYGITSLLAGGASMILILPAIIDLRANGEALSEITKWKTDATNVWDLVFKNMIAVYDTTKYDSIPFIYAGIFPLALCIFYFVSKNIPWRKKFWFGGIFAVLIASFYIAPLDLFWHGMHSPNMFLFRYAFLFSFLVVMLAGYGWEQLRHKDLLTLAGILLVMMTLYCVAWGMREKDTYEYVQLASFVLTLAFSAIYLLTISYYQTDKMPKKIFAVLIMLVMSAEALVNTNGMLHGILEDWNYASRSLFTEPYDDIKSLVDLTKKENDNFYRLENLDGVSANDGLNYNYSGVSLFSSIRNRHSSGYLDKLGFRSRGTNLNIRYANNTLLMDSFTGIKYNIAEGKLNKFGFDPVKKSGDLQLYRNNYALPLGFMAPITSADVKVPENDNLTAQTNLFNSIADTRLNYFNFYPLKEMSTTNALISDNGNIWRITEQTSNVAKEVTWQVNVPANTQAYLSLYPNDFSELESSDVTIKVNGAERKTQININGQYYNLGYYPTDTTLTLTASFYGTKSVSFQEPKVLGLDTNAYRQALQKIQKNAVDFKVKKETATATANATQDELLVTTIPYDKGWSAYVDGQKVPIKNFQTGLVSFEVPKGKHTIKLKYRPQGFVLGAILFVFCSLLFYIYQQYLNKKQGLTNRWIPIQIIHFGKKREQEE